VTSTFIGYTPVPLSESSGLPTKREIVQTAYKGPITHDPGGGRSQEALGYRVL